MCNFACGSMTWLTRMLVYVYICIYTCMDLLCTQIHTRTHARTHTHTHTHARTHTEEAEITENGEEIVGFGLRKLLKESADETQANTPSEDTVSEKKNFSLDFPPGLVHLDGECATSHKRWSQIKRILKHAGRRRDFSRPAL